MRRGSEESALGNKRPCGQRVRGRRGLRNWGCKEYGNLGTERNCEEQGQTEEDCGESEDIKK